VTAKIYKMNQASSTLSASVKPFSTFKLKVTELNFKLP